MTSLQRKMQRAKFGPAEFKRRREEAGREFEQPTKLSADGSYTTLRPTKGWLRTSIKRLKVQRLMAYLLGDR